MKHETKDGRRLNDGVKIETNDEHRQCDAKHKKACRTAETYVEDVALKNLDVPLTNRGFLLGCARIAQAILDAGEVDSDGIFNAGSIFKELKRDLVDDKFHEMEEHYGDLIHEDESPQD